MGNATIFTLSAQSRENLSQMDFDQFWAELSKQTMKYNFTEQLWYFEQKHILISSSIQRLCTGIHNLPRFV